VKLLKAAPASPVKDVVKATAFYRDRLGFSIGYTDESFGIVTRNGLKLHLWEANGERWSRWMDAVSSTPVVGGAESFLAGTDSCRIEIEGIDQLYAELKTTDALYGSDTIIEETAWQTREFAALDLERNLLTFYERIGG
jgi:hypothetical protein